MRVGAAEALNPRERPGPEGVVALRSGKGVGILRGGGVGGLGGEGEDEWEKGEGRRETGEGGYGF